MNEKEALNIISQIVAQANVKVADAPQVLAAMQTITDIINNQDKDKEE